MNELFVNEKHVPLNDSQHVLITKEYLKFQYALDSDSFWKINISDIRAIRFKHTSDKTNTGCHFIAALFHLLIAEATELQNKERVDPSLEIRYKSEGVVRWKTMNIATQGLTRQKAEMVIRMLKSINSHIK